MLVCQRDRQHRRYRIGWVPNDYNIFLIPGASYVTPEYVDCASLVCVWVLITDVGYQSGVSM